jgi:hypothetical protein
MNELKDALDRVLRDPPPSAVDVDAVLVRERRRGRRLRAAAAGSAAVAAAGLITGITVLSPLGTGGGVAGRTASVPVANPGRPPSSAPAPGNRAPSAAHGIPVPTLLTPSSGRTSWPLPKCPPGTDMEVAAPEGQRPLPVGRGPRLTAALTKAVHAVAGNPRLADSRWGSVDRPLVFSGGPCDPKYARYMASAAVLGPSGARLGDLTVLLDWDNGSERKACRPLPEGQGEPELACVERVGPRGEKVVAVTQRLGKQGSATAIWYDVTITRPDGTVVLVNGGGAGPGQPTPPFTVNQLIAIGLDPGLTLS